MNKENRKDMNPESENQVFGGFPAVSRGEDVTLRDDLYEFSALLDAVKAAKTKSVRFRLIDTGQLNQFQVEWLAEAGADVYTSDEARTDLQELELISRACKKGDATSD